MPNQNNPSNSSPIPIISPQSDLPPLPPTFQEVKTVTKTTTEPVTPPSGGIPPANSPPIISSKPAKKFGGGRIIATLLGILLLVGGIGAGLILTQQQQLFNQKAGSNCCRQGQTKSCSIGGKSGVQHCVSTDPDNCVGQVYKGAWGACQVSNNPPNECKPQCSGKTCGAKDGCGNTCDPSSGCNFCSSASTSYCSNRGGCVPDSNGGHCESTGVGSCGSGLNCSGSPISGGTKCTQPNGNEVYCCTSGKIIVNGQCQTESTCGSDVCKFPQVCDRATNTCKYVSDSTCGRNVDTGAPVCCSDAVKSSCANKVCEAPNRLECNINGVHCTIDANGCTNGSNPPPGGPTASCQAIKAYSSAYAPLSATQLSALTPGTDINICVTGTTTGGSFDKAKFDIIEDGTDKPQTETTTKGQGAAAAAFCQPYKIPAGVKSFKFTAAIHHSSLGWSN